MPRTEVYQLRLTKAEKDQLTMLAREEGISVARFLRYRAGLDAPAKSANTGPSDSEITVLANRIFVMERVPMTVARREAKKRLEARNAAG